jgi:hypothetical protein
MSTAMGAQRVGAGRVCGPVGSSGVGAGSVCGHAGCGEHLAAAAAEAVFLGAACMPDTGRPSCRHLGWFQYCCDVLWVSWSGVCLTLPCGSVRVPVAMEQLASVIACMFPLLRRPPAAAVGGYCVLS